MPTAHSANLTITGATYVTSLGTTNLTVTSSPSVISFPANGIGSTTLSIQGLPNYVAKGELQITYTLIATGPGGTSLSSDIEVELFLTQSSPIGRQSTVWRDVLEFGCEWGIGLNSDSQIRAATTNALFDSAFFSYSPYSATYKLQIIGTSHQRFYLQQLFVDVYSSPFSISGDCRDISNYLSTTWNGLGLATETLQLYAYSPPGSSKPLSPFRTHPTASIGTDPNDDGVYLFHDFNFHQIVEEPSGDTYDAVVAQRFDLQGQSYRRPAVAWPTSDYFQKSAGQIHYYPPFSFPSAFVGLARNYSSHVSPEGEEVSPFPIEVEIYSYSPPDE